MAFYIFLCVTIFFQLVNRIMMEVILEKKKLMSCLNHGLGLLISLRHSTLAPSMVTIVGHCSCTQAVQEIPELCSLHLPTPDWPETALVARSHYPGGCDVGRGVWACVDSRSTHNHIWRILTSKTNMLEVLNPTVFVVISSVDCEVECFSVTSGTLSSQPVQIADTSVQEYLNNNTALCRLTTSVPLCIPRSQPVSSILSSAEGFISDPSTLFFVPSKPSRVFSEATSQDSTVKSILPHKTKSHDKPPTLLSSSQHIAHTSTGPISVQLLTDHNQTIGGLSLSVSKPLPEPCLRMHLPVDALALVHLDSPLREVAAILKKKVVDYLRAVPTSLTWEVVIPPLDKDDTAKERKEDAPCSVTVHHVALKNQNCPVTVIYPYKSYLWEVPEKATPITTDDLRPYREELHKRFCLARDLPYLRVPRHNKPESPWLSRNATLCTGAQLLNPHLHLRQTVTGGSLATVQGDYLYYHYMQDGFNDSGWGCAYRSLQTLWSWFLLQGYTSKTPPTHREIQESLVEAKDKEVSLIGSKQWIGSFEVNLTLNQLLQVTSKIREHIQGSDMATVGRELLEHFRTQGTPVMIGGGVLAHTILGVSFNEVTGDTQFLILDPHYTGKEDIKTITEKGKWCGWKSVSFWNSNAHYNLCLPLRPDDVV